MGSFETDDPDNRNLCVNARVSIVSIDYRLAPEHPFPTQVEDSYAGLKWVSKPDLFSQRWVILNYQVLQNADKFSVDHKKGIIVGGLSAGKSYIMFESPLIECHYRRGYRSCVGLVGSR